MQSEKSKLLPPTAYAKGICEIFSILATPKILYKDPSSAVWVLYTKSQKIVMIFFFI